MLDMVALTMFAGTITISPYGHFLKRRSRAAPEAAEAQILDEHSSPSTMLDMVAPTIFAGTMTISPWMRHTPSKTKSQHAMIYVQHPSIAIAVVGRVDDELVVQGNGVGRYQAYLEVHDGLSEPIRHFLERQP